MRMPDKPALHDMVSDAHELGADILAKLDQLTQQPQRTTEGPSIGVTLEERQLYAKEAMAKMDAIVSDYLARVKAQDASKRQEQATKAEEEIARIKAGIGV
jgi:hypothetical protein